MHLWALNLRSGPPTNLCWRISVGDEGSNRVLVEIRVPRRGRRWRHLEVSAGGRKKGSGDSSSSGDNEPSVPDGHDDSNGSNSAFDKAKSDDSQFLNLDWRTFRANLVAQEQVPRGDCDDGGDQEMISHNPSKTRGTKWAHPIAMPETGCILVATEKLDGVRNFERSVILLLRLGNRDPRKGPFGVILNHPLLKKIKHMKPANTDLATTFADCTLHFGGPLDASMFLLKTDRSSPLEYFEQVVPGISFGSRNSLDEAAELVKKGVITPQHFRFFVGYAGWQLDQLIEEIESEYWVVAACSSDLISSVSDSSTGLWEEILQLMGGQYSELSRKPKQDNF